MQTAVTCFNTYSSSKSKSTFKPLHLEHAFYPVTSCKQIQLPGRLATLSSYLGNGGRTISPKKFSDDSAVVILKTVMSLFGRYVERGYSTFS